MMLRRWFAFLFLYLSLLANAPVHAQSCTAEKGTEAQANGRLLDTQPYAFPFESYEAWLAFMDKAPAEGWRAPAMKKLYPKADFERWLGSQSVKAERLRYMSDGLRINGLIVAPIDATEPLPVIVYAHGGVGRWSRLTTSDVLEMHRLAERGFLVIASLRRGEGGSEGQPNMGCGDLRDMLSLVKLIDTLPSADTNRLHYLGFSRGGALGYRVLRVSDRFESAVMIGAPSDLVTSPRRQEFHENVYPDVVDDYARDPDAALKALSAVYWADQLHKNTRMLLLHGASDTRVDVSESRRMAKLLSKAAHRHSLIVYEEGSHSLIEHKESVRVQIEVWMTD